jgi:tetratricopeptide (TPR) repeat protein
MSKSRTRHLFLARRILFALLICGLFFAAASLVLKLLEKKKLIRTERPDDRVAYLSPDAFVEERTAQGVVVHFADEYMIKYSFSKKKPPNTFRLFVTGSSFAMGTPYVYQRGQANRYGFGGIADWVQAELEARYPSRRIEIINAAVNGQNSTRVAEIVKYLVEYEPDAIFVATGNNEGFVPGTPFNQELHQWVLYRLLKRALLKAPRLEERSYFTPQDPNVQSIQRNFEKNIRSIIGLTQAKHIPLLLATMPINLQWDFPRDQIKPPLEDDPHLTAGRRLLADGKYRDAIAEFNQSARQDFAAKFIGECFEALGDFKTARNFYLIHVQLHPGTRTRPSFDAFVREAAKTEGVHLVDLAQMAEDNSPHGIPGSNLFVDYCHFKWTAYYLAAQELIKQLLGLDLIHGAADEPLAPPTLEQIIARKNWKLPPLE